MRITPLLAALAIGCQPALPPQAPLVPIEKSQEDRIHEKCSTATNNILRLCTRRDEYEKGFEEWYTKNRITRAIRMQSPEFDAKEKELWWKRNIGELHIAGAYYSAQKEIEKAILMNSILSEEKLNELQKDIDNTKKQRNRLSQCIKNSQHI